MVLRRKSTPVGFGTASRVKVESRARLVMGMDKVLPDEVKALFFSKGVMISAKDINDQTMHCWIRYSFCQER